LDLEHIDQLEDQLKVVDCMVTRLVVYFGTEKVLVYRLVEHTSSQLKKVSQQE